MTSAPEDPPALFCPTCTYDLRYTTDPRCPECGTPFDRSQLAVSRIPWVHRKQKSLGTFKAWRKTFLLTLRHPTHLAREIALPVDVRAASQFRWLNVLLATGLLAAAIPILYPFTDPRSFRAHINFTIDNPAMAIFRILAPAFAVIDGPVRLFTIPIATVATVAAISWWITFCFWIFAKPESCRPRAAALSLYLSVWLPIAAFVESLNFTCFTFIHDTYGQPTALTNAAMFSISIPSSFIWWLATLLLFTRSTAAGLPRTLLFAIIFPMGVLFLMYAVPIAVLFLLGLLAVMIVSLTT